jgi:hypothetical protein
LQLILDVRRDIFPPLRQTGQSEAHILIRA